MRSHIRFLAVVTGAFLGLFAVVAQADIVEFSAGISPGAHPFGITAGPDGNVWFTEPGVNRIGRITPEGVVTEFNAGSTATDAPRFIAAGGDGNLWFTRAAANGIGRITPAGVVTEFTAGIWEDAQPTAITADVNGNVWFLDPMRHRIGRIAPSGIVTEIDWFFGAGYSIAATPDGYLWFPGGDAGIFRMTPTGAVTAFSTESVVSDVAGGPDGTIWFTMGDGRIGRITTQGEKSYFTTGGWPERITVGPDGNLWFTQSGDVWNVNGVGRITPLGATTAFTAGISPNSYPMDIAVGPDGNLWFAEYNASRIGRIATDDPTGLPFGTMRVVEYYAASLDHYFMTGTQAEVWALDRGAYSGAWQRTGKSFLAWGVASKAPAAAVPVCRLFVSYPGGATHFYSAYANECAAASQYMDAPLMLESIAAMYVVLPDAGYCPIGADRVYRLWSNRSDGNHRFTTDPEIVAQMKAQGWVQEGSGPGFAIMCVPI
jgi:streptogramin lyase